MTDFHCQCEYKMTGCRCPKKATQEDGLCDECRDDPKCVIYRRIEAMMAEIDVETPTYNELMEELGKESR